MPSEHSAALRALERPDPVRVPVGSPNMGRRPLPLVGSLARDLTSLAQSRAYPVARVPYGWALGGEEDGRAPLFSALERGPFWESPARLRILEVGRLRAEIEHTRDERGEARGHRLPSLPRRGIMRKASRERLLSERLIDPSVNAVEQRAAEMDRDWLQQLALERDQEPELLVAVVRIPLEVSKVSIGLEASDSVALQLNPHAPLRQGAEHVRRELAIDVGRVYRGAELRIEAIDPLSRPPRGKRREQGDVFPAAAVLIDDRHRSSHRAMHIGRPLHERLALGEQAVEKPPCVGVAVADGEEELEREHASIIARLRHTAIAFPDRPPQSCGMCGRYESDLRSLPGIDRFAELVGTRIVDELASVHSLDVRPTNLMPVLTRSGSGEPWAVERMRWGLLPPWAQRKKLKPAINARAETVAEKPYFRSAFRDRRAIVVASAFFEWQVIEGQRKKEKLRFARADGLPLCMAALWEPSEDAPCYTIITTDAGPDVVDVHDRQPVIVEMSDLDAWLNEPESDLLTPSPEGRLVVG